MSEGIWKYIGEIYFGIYGVSTGVGVVDEKYFL